jgi:hypothetical protein
MIRSWSSWRGRGRRLRRRDALEMMLFLTPPSFCSPSLDTLPCKYLCSHLSWLSDYERTRYVMNEERIEYYKHNYGLSRLLSYPSSARPTSSSPRSLPPALPKIPIDFLPSQSTQSRQALSKLIVRPARHDQVRRR